MDIQALIDIKNKTHYSYKQMAAKYLGDENLSETLRLKMREYKRENIYILEPAPQLFDDVLQIPYTDSLVLADIHCPFQDKEHLLYAFEQAKKQNIQQLIITGDLVHLESYNSLRSMYERYTTVDTDIHHARVLLQACKKIFPRIIINKGNHDNFYLKKHKCDFSCLIRDVILKDEDTSMIQTTERDYIHMGEDYLLGHISGAYSPIAGLMASVAAQHRNRHVLVGHIHTTGYVQADNGRYGISIGSSCLNERFWYYVSSINPLPLMNNGFVIIQERTFYHYAKQGNVYEMEMYS